MKNVMVRLSGSDEAVEMTAVSKPMGLPGMGNPSMIVEHDGQQYMAELQEIDGKDVWVATNEHHESDPDEHLI